LVSALARGAAVRRREWPCSFVPAAAPDCVQPEADLSFRQNPCEARWTRTGQSYGVRSCHISRCASNHRSRQYFPRSLCFRCSWRKGRRCDPGVNCRFLKSGDAHVYRGAQPVAEDWLSAAVASGVRQAVVPGVGLAHSRFATHVLNWACVYTKWTILQHNNASLDTWRGSRCCVPCADFTRGRQHRSANATIEPSAL
jgi:hypothetical protein